MTRAERVLVVDDQPLLRRAVGRHLRLQGFDVREAEDGAAGLEEALRWLPDVVVCDIDMPRMNGIELLNRLRGDPVTAGVPFLFLTGRSDPEDIRKGMTLGADDYLTKPFDITAVQDAVVARLERSRMLARKLDDLRRTLASTVAHELVTPLNVVLGYSRHLLDGARAGEVPAAAELELFSSHLVAGAERLLLLVRRHALFAEAAGAQAVCAATGTVRSGGPVPTSSLAHGPAVTRLLVERPGAAVSWEAAVLACEPSWLEAALGELVDNALRHGGDGRVELDGRALADGAYAITVRDHGPGLAPGQMEHGGAFVQQGRLCNERTGSGLGLPIVRCVAESHGGALHLRNHSEGGLEARLVLRIASPEDVP